MEDGGEKERQACGEKQTLQQLGAAEQPLQQQRSVSAALWASPALLPVLCSFQLGLRLGLCLRVLPPLSARLRRRLT